MRHNLPVTNQEVMLEEGESIVSRTDLRGKILFVNRAFLRISGYAENELLGQPHNIIRHPDMPSAAFADLWATLKAGRPWVGIVKNRCKNGDHYWIEAHATPVYEDGEVVGYMSVRRQATREQIDFAERAYAGLRAGDRRLELRHGSLAVPRTLLHRLNPLWLMSLRQRLLLAGAGFGAYGLVLMAMVRSALPPTWMLGAIGAGTACALYCAWWLSRDVVDRLDEARRHCRMLSAGHYDQRIPIDRDDEIGGLFLAMKSVQVRLGFEMQDQRRRADEALRVQSALDAADVNMMIADHDFRIIYANPSMREMMRKAQDDLRRALPDFDADALVGSSMDVFHRDPAHQRSLLADLETTYRATITPGGRRFDLVVTPVRDERGKRIGLVTEWRDRTVEMGALEREIDGVVRAAARGDFSQRIDLSAQEGFLQVLGGGVNDLLVATEVSLRETLAAIRALSEGDLRHRIDREMHGLFGEMRDGTNATFDHLTGLVATIRGASEEVNSAAGEIAAGNNDLSQRTEQQAASLEETASSMEELTSTVKQNADNARQANQLAQGAAEVAEQGGAVVGQVVHTMSAISESSKKIADIIGVIDGIAFQTNILALNAAVEAARAGEQGRGFAVVASEVRSLAQRSANAAKEIKQLITDSVGKVEEGSALVDRAGRTMGEIVTSVKRVTDIIADIAAASAEQSAGIEQVNQAITSMDEGTQQNAALVEEASASARSLEQQAEQLVQTVAVFRVDAARLAHVERPHAADVVELAAPRMRKPAPVAARPAPRKPRAQAIADSHQWTEF